MSPILDMQRRLHEVGHIRIGVQVPAKKKDGTPTTRPAKLETFRVTSANRAAIEAIARIHGGTVAKWDGAPTGTQWEVITESDQLRVLVPPESMSFSQFYELWSGGGCVRRCNGSEQLPSEDPCVCDPENRECTPHTRVSVMLADVPTSGLWRLNTQGYYAAVELSGGFEMATLIAKASGRSVLSGTLRLDQREIKRPGQQTRKFAVPVIDFDVDVRAFLGDTTSLPAAPEPAQLGTGVTPIPRDDTPAPSLSEQLHAVETPPTPSRRANAAVPLPPTGLAPRKASDVPAVDTSAQLNAAVHPEPDSPASESSPTVNERQPDKANRTAGGASRPSMRRLFALLGGKGIRDDSERHAWASTVLQRDVTTFSELTQADVSRLNDAATGAPSPEEPEYGPGEEPF